MPSSRLVRAQIEAALAERIPSALTPQARILRPVAATTIPEIDALLDGGLPVGAISEITGPESSGRTSLALAFIAGLTQAGKVCAWVDVSNAFHPESAAAIGVDLSRMLWVRCGASPAQKPRQSLRRELDFPEKYTTPPPVTKGLHGGGHGPHPRTEGKGLSASVSDLFGFPAPCCSEPVRKPRPQRNTHEPEREHLPGSDLSGNRVRPPGKPWLRLEQGLRVTDLLLQAGGWASIVLDMGSIAPENALRVPLATWFRFRAAAERLQLNFLLLTQHPCAKNSAGLVLRLNQEGLLREESTLLAGMNYRAALAQQRFQPQETSASGTGDLEQVVALRKPPQSVGAYWRSRTSWTGRI
jgi:recombination protein RecA